MMTLQDLERAGLTLPRSQWGRTDTRSRVNAPLFLIALAAAAIACVFMYAGAGRSLTWVGAVLFVASLLSITGLLLRATTLQSRSAQEHSNELQAPDDS